MEDPRLGLPSASAAYRDKQCPGSHLACLDLPSEESGDSLTGVKIHKAFFDSTYVGLDDEEILTVQLAQQIEEEVANKWQASLSGMRRTELRLWCYHNTDRICSGEIDVCYIDRKYRRALIEDLKSLFGSHADSPTNMQLRDLAALMFLNYEDLDEISVFINQPRVTRRPVVTVYQRADLIRAAEEMRARVLRSMEKNQPRFAGDWCKFCRARATCPQALGTALILPTPQPWPTLPPELKRHLWERCAMAEAVIKKIRENVYADLTADPNAIPGLVKNPDSTIREISDLMGAYEKFNAIGCTPEDFTKLCEITVGNAEKLFGTLRPEIMVKDRKAAFNQEFAACIALKPKRGSIEKQ